MAATDGGRTPPAAPPVRSQTLTFAALLRVGVRRCHQWDQQSRQYSKAWNLSRPQPPKRVLCCGACVVHNQERAVVYHARSPGGAWAEAVWFRTVVFD